MTIMDCYTEMVAVKQRRLDSDEMTVAKALLWHDWLMPWDIPTADLRQSFILGNWWLSQEEGRNPHFLLEPCDVGQGYRVLIEKRRAAEREAYSQGPRRLTASAESICKACGGTGRESVRTNEMGEEDPRGIYTSARRCRSCYEARERAAEAGL